MGERINRARQAAPEDHIFAWTPEEWAKVGCGDARRLTSGWSILQPQPGFPFSPAPAAPI